jgi:uncharacterized protein YdaU (DUF1376 family)
MSNGNSEWMPLYIGDYLGDTMELDGAQHGAYLLLLMYYWRNGPLPVEDTKLAQIARTDLRLWRKSVGPVVRGYFTELNGRLHQKRADKELARAEGISAKRRAAADARWNGGHQHPPDRDANADANASGLHDVCTAFADANGMLRASASPLPVPRKRKEEPPYPHGVGEGTPAAPGTPPRRSNGSNPRATGTNPRSKPAAIPWRSGAIQLVYEEGQEAKAGEEIEDVRDQNMRDDVTAFLSNRGPRYGTS